MNFKNMKMIGIVLGPKGFNSVNPMLGDHHSISLTCVEAMQDPGKGKGEEAENILFS